METEALRRSLPDEAATIRLGADIALALEHGDVVALSGELGAGKTTLARAVIRTLAADPALEVPSPSFTLVQAYDLDPPVHHFDLYRLAAPEEAGELGIGEAAQAGIVLVEWPERAPSFLPGENLAAVRLDEDGAGRSASISATPALMARIARSLEIRAFLDRAGAADAVRTHLVGDASTRAYETVDSPETDRRILMNAPRRPDGPPIRDGKPYSAIAHLAESVTPFAAIARALTDAGFAAPRIFASDLDAGLLLIEHLGTETMLDAHGVPIEERYLAAAGLLASLHERPWPREVEVEPGIVHRIPDYDRDALHIETELLTDWYLPFVQDRQADPDQRRRFRQAWDRLFDRLGHAEKSLVLRDYHSPNVIWRGDREGEQRIGLIDFQDALIGPSAYDVASLAFDARVTVPPALERRIAEAYLSARGFEGADREAFEEAYAITAAQRNSKILGIFVRLDRRDGKPAYLKHLPRIRDYLASALAHPSLAELAALYREWGIVGGDDA